MTDEMLPETEWPGLTVLEVSVETRDNGLGMYSSVSENPTLFRTTGLGVCAICATGGGRFLNSAATGSGANAISSVLTATTFSGAGKFWLGGRSVAAGLVGALFPFPLGLGGGTSIDDRSWLEMAADRR